MFSESPLLMEIKQSSENILKSSKISYAETSEDSTSQAPSNQSEISDENAPILGRRAERSCVLPEMISDESENSDSDWESFQVKFFSFSGHVAPFTFPLFYSRLILEKL